MDFSALLARAWRIVWENKYLFLLGFLATLGSGMTPRTSVNYTLDFGDFGPGFETRAEQFLDQYWAVFLGLICVVLVVGLILWLVRLATQGGLIYAASRLDAGEKLTFGQTFSAGISKLGPLVGLNIVVFGGFTLVGIIVAGIAVAGFSAVIITALSSGTVDAEALLSGTGIFLLCMCALACVLIPLYLLAMVVYPFAQRGLVLRNMGVFASIGHGWRVVTSNLAEVLILIVLFIAIGIVFAVVTGLILLPLGALALLPATFNLLDAGTLELGNIVALVVGGVLLSLVVGVINAVLVAFRSTAVTLAYEEFVTKIV